MIKSFFEKVWSQNIVASLSKDVFIMHIDRNFIHDLSGAVALSSILKKNYKVGYPELTFACPDHTVSTDPNSKHQGERYLRCVNPLRKMSHQEGIHYFDFDDDQFGIIHVVGPETGLSFPGALIVCGDSHTCTHGGLGALAWGIGASEVGHALVTGTIIQKKPKSLNVSIVGTLAPGVVAKDLILNLIAREGVAVGDNFAVEFSGSAIRQLSVEGRMTICNMAIEMGSKIGMVAPDDKTFEFLAGREYSPKGKMWESAIGNWKELKSDEGSKFDKEIYLSANKVVPQISWGTSPEHTIGVDEIIPDPLEEVDKKKRDALAAAIEYTNLRPGTPIEGVSIDRVFLGSCTNSRIEDLVEASLLIKGRKVCSKVEAWVVPGSRQVKQEAERRGLDKVFANAGFQWREPGCSMCVGSNGELMSKGMRCVSTSNRNFIGRQGEGSYTHLGSPLTAVASAIKGVITDPRKLIS